ncbi:MAG: SAM-dependent methyltransferase, partial [Caldimicrobium sp.]
MMKALRKNPWFDKWAKLAKEKGYPARSVFKLKEIQERFKIIKPGYKILDLGASPGSWSQFACEI